MNATSNSMVPHCGLYIVAVPIGHPLDLTLRALETLKQVDLVLCEDTRVTGQLFQYHQIRTPLRSYHEHNAEQRLAAVLERLTTQKVALVCDAGTPAISDPGYKLVRAAAARDLYVTAVPGPSAGLMALTLSGLPTDRFVFAGFLPSKRSLRLKQFETFKAFPSTFICYESPKRLHDSLQDLYSVFGAIEVALARELTKKYEEVLRGRLDRVLETLATRSLKGEIVIVCSIPRAAGTELSPPSIEALLREELQRHSLKLAVKSVVAQTGRPRKEIYELALQLQEGLAD